MVDTGTLALFVATWVQIIPIYYKLGKLEQKAKNIKEVEK